MAKLYTCRNFSLIGKNKLAKDAFEAFIKGNSILTLIHAVFYTHTFRPA